MSLLDCPEYYSLSEVDWEGFIQEVSGGKDVTSDPPERQAILQKVDNPEACLWCCVDGSWFIIQSMTDVSSWGGTDLDFPVIHRVILDPLIQELTKGK